MDLALARHATAPRHSAVRVSARPRSGLARLLAGISTGAAALALSLAPHAARAANPGGVAVNGTPTAQFGVASITRTPTLDTVTVNAKEALIDWASSDPSVYLPQGNTLQFQGTNAFTVLNRVDGAAPLAINGTVASGPNGAVWFYNPGGWVVGSTGVFNVGSLVLTSNPIAVTAGVPDGQRFVDSNGAIHFAQGLSGSGVTVQPGAQINASGNYVALVAPRVVQGGTVTTNGSTAYVGAEAATLTVNNAMNGMFDITVDTGTTDANGVVHTGTTTGPAAINGGPAHQIALVTVPKNQLVTMLVSGNLGYTAANVAQGEVDGTIVLGSGYNIANGGIGTSTFSATGGSVRLSALATTNNTQFAVSDSATIDATGSSLVFAKSFLGSAFNAIDVNVSGVGHTLSTGTDLILGEYVVSPNRSITISASNGGTINVGGKTDLFNATGLDTGVIAINAKTGGAITLGGDLAIVSSTAVNIGVADAGSKLQVGGAAAFRSSNGLISQLYGTRGGAITLSAANGATLAFAQTLDVRVDASGGVTLDPANSAQLLPGSVGVAATAGSITATNTDATFTVDGSTRLESLAYGGIGAASAGSATSGSVSFTQTGASATSRFGTVNAGGFLSLSSSGDSAYLLQYPPTFPATGAASSSGAVTLSVTGGNFAAGSIMVDSTANASYGLAATPYAATAGAVGVTFANGSYTATGLSLSNTAHDYNEGVVTAGKVSLTLDNSSLALGSGSLFASTLTHGTVQTPGGLAVKLLNGSALTTSSFVGLSSRGEESGSGPATAADLTLQISGSTLDAGQVFLNSSGYGGDISPDGSGGLASVTLDSGSRLTTTSGGLQISSQGNGTDFNPDAVNGGTGTGGTARLSVSNSVVSLAGDVQVSAPGVAGSRPTGTGRSGASQGGNASIAIDGGSASLTATFITIEAPGRPLVSEGSVSQPAGGTSGSGGSSQIVVSNGAQVSATSLTLDATGSGGDAFNVAGSPPAKGGTGAGGTATLTLDGSGGTITVPTITLDTSGYGGTGADLDPDLKIAAGDGGVGRGGTSTLNLFGGTLTTNALTLDANGNQQLLSCTVDCGSNNPIIYAGIGGGVAGSTSATAGAGGTGFGGTSTLSVNGGTLSGSVTTIKLDAFGQGGLGGPATSGGPAVLTRGAGGTGAGGTAQLFFDGGSIAARRISVNASAAGGSGGFELADVANPLTDSPANAGAGGSATGGTAIVEVSETFNSNFSGLAITVSADGVGANGLAGVSGGAGGSGTGGFADFEINGSTTVADLTVRANGAGGAGGDSTLANAGAIGGNGAGGTARIVADNQGTGMVAGYLVSAQGTGGAGGTGGSGSVSAAVAGNGGQGGAARGGSAIIEADGGSALTLDQSDTGDLVADATGGMGGNGGDAGRFGFAQRGNGANGGDASGGSLQFIVTGGSTLDLGDADYSIRTTGGNGGEVVGGLGPVNPQPSLGGAGGRGDFGEIRLDATDAGSTIKATSLVLNANAGGGSGGDGYGTNPTTGDGTPGASGGDSAAPRISLLADTGGSIAIATDGAVNLTAAATGGNGGNASAALAGTGGAGGRGGDGGAGFDAAVTVQTGTDASIGFGANVTSNLAASGKGGRGGDGGAGASNVTVSGNGGNGGDSGTSGSGFGGAITLVANGGAITTGDLALTASGMTPIGLAGGQGGAGGAGGPGQTIPSDIMGQPPVIIPPGANGSNGGSGYFSPVGGKVAITAADNGGMGGVQYGTLSLGNVNAMVTSQAKDIDSQFISYSGSIALKDTTNAAGTGLYAQSLSLDAGGFSDISPVGVTLLSIHHPVTVADTITVNADGTVQFTGQLGGGLTAGDTIELFSNHDINLDTLNSGKFSAGTVNLTAAGNIQLSSAGCAVQSCVVVHADGDFTALSYNSQFILSGPAQVEGLGSISVTTGAEILGDRGSGYLSTNDVKLLGGGDVQVRNVQAGMLTVDAGAVNTQGGVLYNTGTLSLGEDGGTGRIITHNGQDYRSGGSIKVLGASRLSAGLGITFSSANDIVVGQNASIAANVGNSDTSGPILFYAGSLLSTTPPADGDFASLRIGSGTTVDAGADSITLFAGAIDARGASFNSGFFRADVTDNLSLTSPQGNDGGQLSAPCLDADICLGSITASGPVRIGSSETVPLHVMGTGSISGESVDIFSQGTLSIGSSGQLVKVTSSGAIGLTSYSGDVALTGGASLTGASVDISAGGSLMGNGRVTATGQDIGLSVGGDIVADSLSARQLTASGQTGDPLEPKFATPGNFTVNTLSLTTGAAIQAGGNIGLAQANLGGNALSLTASGRTSLQAAGGVTDLTLTGQSVDFGSIATTGFFTANAKAGLTGTSATAGTAFAGSGSTIAVNAIASGTDTTLNGGAMTLGTIDAKANLAITATGAVTLNRGAAGGALAITADMLTTPLLKSGGNATLLVTKAVTLGTVTAGGNILIDPTVVSFTALTSAGSTAIVADDVLGGTIDAGTSIMIDATGRVVLDRANAGTTLAIGAATIAAPALTSGGAMTLTSSGQATLGTLNSGAGLQIAAKPLSYGTVTAAGPVAISASIINGGAIASSGGALALTSAGAVTTGALSSGTDATIQADALNFTSLNSGGSATITASSVSSSPITAAQDVTVTSGTTLSFQTIKAGRNATLIAKTGNVTVSSDLAVGGTASAAGDAVALNAKGALSLGTIVARGGDIAVVAGGALGLSDGQAIGNISLTAQQGALTLGKLAAGYQPTSTLGNPAGASATSPRGPGNIVLSGVAGISASGSIDSAAALTGTTSGAISLGALTTANTIGLTSSDLVLGATAQLGQVRTTSLTLTNNGSTGMVLGDGFDTLGGYLISNAEFARIHSGGSLTIDAGTATSASSTARLTIGTLAVTAATGTTDGNVASDGTLSLRSGNGVSILGAATFSNASSNTLAISASSDILVDAMRGSLRLLEGSGRGGTLALDASRVLAVTPQALTDVSAATSTAAITTRLSASDGITSGATLLEAGALNVSVARGFYVQNTAPLTGFDDRRGLVADSLTITASGINTNTNANAAPITIVANGLVNGLSGIKAVPVTRITGAFDQQSSLNGCVIVAVATCNQPKAFDNPIKDVIRTVLGGPDAVETNTILSIGNGFFNAPLMTLNQIAPAGFAPLIDEPVTGTGNDDLVGDLTRIDLSKPSKKPKPKLRTRAGL